MLNWNNDKQGRQNSMIGSHSINHLKNYAILANWSWYWWKVNNVKANFATGYKNNDWFMVMYIPLKAGTTGYVERTESMVDWFGMEQSKYTQTFIHYVDYRAS